MPRFAANLSLLYSELDFLDRFEAAAKDGFQAVEFLFPYAWPKHELAARLRNNGLRQVLFNAPPGGTDPASIAAALARGERGMACIPGRADELQKGFALALAYAEALECPRIHLMAGQLPVSLDRAAAEASYRTSLTWACAAAQGLDVMIEPINGRDVPRYFLNRQDAAHQLLNEIGAGNLKVQMDLYHCQIVEGDIVSKIRQYLPTGKVGHFQIAGVPGRNEPDTGELQCDYVFAVIDEVARACAWQGWVGCEYHPLRGAVEGGTTAGLTWLRR